MAFLNYMSHRGFTLIELMLSVSLFLVIMLAATTLFSRTADTQGKALAIKNLQESSDYTLQFIKREAETAKQGLGGCGFPCGGANDYFCTSGASNDHLYLRNKNDECVHYFLQTDSNGVQRLAVTRNNLPSAPYYTYITPADVAIVGLKFSTAALTNDPDFISGRLTMFISARPSSGTAVDSLNLQTSIAVRPFVCGQTIYDRDNFDYKTVLIGNQCWLAENLKTKSKRNGTALTNLSAGSERDCVANPGVRGTETDCDNGYALYTWAGMMNGDTAAGSQGICPDGWHIPTDAEQLILINRLGGLTQAGAKLISNGSSGFEALMAGDREPGGNSFAYYGNYVNFWTSNSSGGSNAIALYFDNIGGDLTQVALNRTYGFSVRCLKN